MKEEKGRKVTLETLAGMVATGFAEQEKKLTGKIDGVESRLTEKLTKEINGLESRLTQQISGINNRIDDLALNRATRDELLVLDKRVARIETKLGIDFKRTIHV